MHQRWGIVYVGPTAGAAQGRPRIQALLETVRSWSAPERTIVVALDAERPWWGPLTAAAGFSDVVAEPFDRGTATGIMVGLLLAARRAPHADVAVLHAGLTPCKMEAAGDAWLRVASAAEVAERDTLVFRAGAEIWPVAIARTQAWLRRMDDMDRARASSLQIAMAQSDNTAEVLDGLYPFLTTLDFRQALLDSDAEPRVVDCASERRAAGVAAGISEGVAVSAGVISKAAANVPPDAAAGAMATARATASAATSLATHA